MAASIQVVEYLDLGGCSPFAAWFNCLNAPAAAKVTAAIFQLGVGNWSQVKGVGRGVFERKVDFGPGYRIYFGKDGETLVVLLGGSTKERQQRAVQAAQERWIDYRRRKITTSI
jgi:putative addiction module killer protein